MSRKTERIGGFWDALEKPIIALAPMADVTDAAFRRIIAKHGKPDVMFTQFVSCDGLESSGREALLCDLLYSEAERPIVAQFFGAKPENFKKCAERARRLRFDGFDINMGCPDRNIEKQGAGAALMKNPNLAKEIIRAAKEGAGNMPVSVKIRIGYNKNEIETWFPAILEEEIAAITVHGRTRKEMSKVSAHWDVIARAKELAKGTKTLIIGNGDVYGVEDALEKAEKYGVDGVMLGRGIFGNPWLFANLASAKGDRHAPHPPLSISDRLHAMVEHTQTFERVLGGVKNFSIMKKHYKAYVNGFPGALELRASLMEANSAGEVAEKIDDFLRKKDIL
ncbi:tRNA-dihydrouridine synthase [bacterium]|nr:tRNA-dihydrouridine synthase [bacterium]MCI0565938.1 tRNA-dihydrouridine synthase [bacterium]MCI0679938.1 tRNA-dihydrouridine synthase [bacterium]